MIHWLSPQRNWLGGQIAGEQEDTKHGDPCQCHTNDKILYGTIKEEKPPVQVDQQGCALFPVVKEVFTYSKYDTPSEVHYYQQSVLCIKSLLNYCILL